MKAQYSRQDRYNQVHVAAVALVSVYAFFPTASRRNAAQNSAAG